MKARAIRFTVRFASGPVTDGSREAHPSTRRITGGNPADSSPRYSSIWRAISLFEPSVGSTSTRRKSCVFSRSCRIDHPNSRPVTLDRENTLGLAPVIRAKISLPILSISNCKPFMVP